MQKEQKETILKTILDLHSWREKYNGTDIGLGTDEYNSEKLHYPQAYAVWGAGYVNLYKSTNNEIYLKNARSCASWLLANPNPRYKGLCWGLPFNWVSNETNIPICVTTLYCANLFFKLFELNQDPEMKSILLSIRKWLIEDNGYIIDLKRTKGIYFKYANDPAFSKSVNFCLTAMASGFFSKLHKYEIGDKETNSYFATSCARFVLKSQQPNGFWYYDDHLHKIDLIHSALLLEGLGHFYNYSDFFKDEAKEGLKSGLNFLANKMIKKDGYSLEIYPSIFICPWRINDYKWLALYLYNVIFNRKKLETRVFGYGITIKALSVCKNIDEQLATNSANILIRYLTNNHLTENNAFRFRPDIPNEYIRDQGHIFDGLTHFLTV